MNTLEKVRIILTMLCEETGQKFHRMITLPYPKEYCEDLDYYLRNDYVHLVVIMEKIGEKEYLTIDYFSFIMASPVVQETVYEIIKDITMFDSHSHEKCIEVYKKQITDSQ